jgi:hypothetical protein
MALLIGKQPLLRMSHTLPHNAVWEVLVPGTAVAMREKTPAVFTLFHSLNILIIFLDNQFQAQSWEILTWTLGSK